MAKMQNIEITIFDQIKPKAPPTIDLNNSQTNQIKISLSDLVKASGTNTEHRRSVRSQANSPKIQIQGQQSDRDVLQLLTVQAAQTNRHMAQLSDHSLKNSPDASHTDEAPSIKKQKTLNERRSILQNLKPIVISRPNSISNSPSTTKKVPKDPEMEKMETMSNQIKEKTMKASDSGLSPGQRKKLLNEAATLKRQITVSKFQNAVKIALQRKRDEEDANKIFYKEPGTPSVREKSFVSGGADLVYKAPNQECMTPGLGKHKMSFFDVVRRLNPFKKSIKNPILGDLMTGDNTNTVQSENPDPQNNAIIEAQMKKRERARLLWRKAKAVVRAINVWKQVQGDIQLYGTHNYEFRQTFQVAQNSRVFRKGNTFRNSINETNPNQRSNEGNKRSDARALDEQQRQNNPEPKRKCQTYIHPEGNFKRTWSFVIMTFMIYTGSIMPYKMAFYDNDESEYLNFIDIVADFIFTADVIINILSAFYNSEGILIINNKKIFLNYLSGWFLIDLAACTPMNLVDQVLNTKQSESSKYSSIIRLFRLPRLYRLVQVTRLHKVFGNLKRSSIFIQFDEFLQRNQGVIKLLQLCMNGIVCVHVAACFWYLTAKLNDFGPLTWVVRNGIINDLDQRKYLTSVYWAVSTVLTVGYGDIHAQTSLERLVSCIWMMTGVAFYSLTIGVITSVLGKIDSRSSQLKSKLAVIDDFCQESKIHHSYKRRIREALEYHSQKNAFSFIQKYQILNELPPNLKYEISMQIHGGAIGKLSFFQGRDMTFIGNVVPLLQPLHVLENDYIYMVDDHPYDIYMILNGRVNFIMDVNECVFKSWPQGSYFGEIEIIFQKKRICTAKAEQECDIFTLNKKFYQTLIFNDYPEIEKQLREMAIEREAKINDTLAKARKVLEALGIQDALTLPHRYNARKASVGSMNNSIKKRQQIEKATKMKKIAMSFETANANKSLSASEFSKKAGLDKTDTANGGSPAKIMIEESSSSGDFNIWGDDNSGSNRESGQEQLESENSNEQLDDKKGSRRKSQKSQQSGSPSQNDEEPKRLSNFSNFSTFFNKNKQNQLAKKTGLKITLKQQEIITSDEEDENGSSDQDKKQILKHNLADEEIKEAEENLEYTVKSPSRREDTNFDNEEIESFNSVNLESEVSKPMIKVRNQLIAQSLYIQINKEEEKINSLLDASLVELERYSQTPANISNNMIMKFASPQTINKMLRESNMSPNCLSPLDPRGYSPKVGLYSPKVGLLPPATPLNQSSIEQINTSLNQSKLTGKSGWGGGAFTSVAIEAMNQLKQKRISEKVQSSALLQIPQKRNSSSTEIQKISQPHPMSSFQYLTPKINTKRQDKRIKVQKQVFQFQIVAKPSKQIPGTSGKDIELQSLELMNMNTTLKIIKEKFKEGNEKKEMIQSKVNSLQSTMDLMAKLLRDINAKQTAKKLSSESHKTTSQKFKNQVSKGEGIHQNPNIKRNERNELRQEQMKMTFMEYKSNIQRNGGQSRNSEVPLMYDSGSAGGYIYRQSLTLNSEHSLVPVRRKVKEHDEKMSSTSVEEFKQKETIREFSYTDDIEMLQREYGEVFNQSLPDQ